MKYSFEQLVSSVLNLDGEPMKVSFDGRPTDKPLTLKQALRIALTADTRDQEATRESDDQKFKDYELARDIYRLDKGQDIEIDNTQAARISSLSLKVWGKEIGGYVRDFFNGKIQTFKPILGGQSENGSGEGAETGEAANKNKGNRRTGNR